MDEDQNNDISYGPLSHNVGIYQYVVATVKDEHNLEQLKVKCHEGIQKYETRLALSNMEYERMPPYHIQDFFSLFF